MIVGAGIVGCYLGKKLGDCEIWEKNNKVIEKACGGLVSKNIKHLDVDISECILNEVKGSKFISDSESFEVIKNTTQAYVLDRLKFQESLAQDAENEGCEILYRRTWGGEEDKFVIGADGAFSSVARFCEANRSYWHTYQVECEMSKKIDPDFVEVHLGDFAPGFFGWVIPIDEKHAKIGLGCNSGNPKENFKKFSKKFKIGEILKEKSAPIPVFDSSQKTVFDNIALVGDAAGQVKATSGGGIIFGLKCADILADAIEKDDLQYYENKWRKLYGRDLKIHLSVRQFLDKQDYDKLFKKVKEKKIDKFMEEHGDMDHPGKMMSKVMKRPDLWWALANIFLKT